MEGGAAVQSARREGRAAWERALPPLGNGVVITGEVWKPPRRALKRCDGNRRRELGINVGREGFDSEQEGMILVIVCKKHSSYLWATTIIGRIM